MESKIKNETNSVSRLAILGVYSFSGVSFLSYLAYRGFK